MIYTLVADGPSDEVLVPILNWSLRQNNVQSVSAQWADFRRIRRPSNFEQRLRIAVELYPCDVLFVHRDAEAQSPELRRAEIAGSLNWLEIPHVPVIPVRMTEAWLLADETAIRCAAGNPNGTEALNLPELRRLEEVPDPKEVLYDALVAASGLNARRRNKFPAQQRVPGLRITSMIFSRLNGLSAFRELQENIRRVIG